MLILNSLKESVERPGVVGTRGLLAEVGYSIWKNRSMRLGVVASCKLHSHHQNGEVLRGKTAQRETEQVNAIGGWHSRNVDVDVQPTPLYFRVWVEFLVFILFLPFCRCAAHPLVFASPGGLSFLFFCFLPPSTLTLMCSPPPRVCESRWAFFFVFFLLFCCMSMLN